MKLQLGACCDFLHDNRKVIIISTWAASILLITYITKVVCVRLESDGEDGITMTMLLVCVIFGGYGGVGGLGAFLIIRYFCCNRQNPDEHSSIGSSYCEDSDFREEGNVGPDEPIKVEGDGLKPRNTLGAIFEGQFSAKRVRPTESARLSVGSALMRTGRAMSWGHHPGSYGGAGSSQISTTDQLQVRQSTMGGGANAKNAKKAPNTLPLSMKPSYQSKENVVAEIRRLDSLLGRRSKIGVEDEGEWRD